MSSSEEVISRSTLADDVLESLQEAVEWSEGRRTASVQVAGEAGPRELTIQDAQRLRDAVRTSAQRGLPQICTPAGLLLLGECEVETVEDLARCSAEDLHQQCTQAARLLSKGGPQRQAPSVRTLQKWITAARAAFDEKP